MNSPEEKSESVDYGIYIKSTHFDWLNHEIIRLGNLARSYSDRADRLKKEVDRLTAENKALKDNHNDSSRTN